MPSFSKDTQFKILVGVLGLVLISAVIFQNCSKSSSVDFSSAPPQVLTSVGGKNGDGYLGARLPPNEYVRSFLKYKCLASSNSNFNLQGRITATASAVTIVEDNCQDISFGVAANDPKLDYLPYDNSYFGYNGAIFESIDSYNSQQGMAVEVFCRASGASDGLDVVAKINPNNSVKAELYLGQLNSGVWTNRYVPSFSVSRSVSQSQASYKNDVFSLRLDLSQDSQFSYPGYLMATVDGKIIERTLACRHMRVESAIVNDTTGLAALWQMNNNLLDSSGNNNHIILVDPNSLLTYSAGVFENSISMTGNPSVNLNANPSPSLNTLKSMSVVAWLYLPNSPGINRAAIASKASAGASILNGWSFYYDNVASTLEFEVACANGVIHATSLPGKLHIGSWQHVVVTWDGVGNNAFANYFVNLYVNGVSAGGITASQYGQQIDDSPFSLSIGGVSIDPTANLLGNLDQVSIWNRVLTPAEIASIYSIGFIK